MIQKTFTETDLNFFFLHILYMSNQFIIPQTLMTYLTISSANRFFLAHIFLSTTQLFCAIHLVDFRI